MAFDQDAGLIKRGFILLGVMSLLVTTVLFILLQGSRPPAAPSAKRAEDLAWSVAIPTAAFPACLSWGALCELSEHVPSAPGYQIRHNAAATLARRGSDAVSWTTFREMLDLQRITINCREQSTDGQESPEATASALVVAALKALADWHAKRREMNKADIPNGLLAVYEVVDKLMDSPIPEIREQAGKTQEAFFAR